MVPRSCGKSKRRVFLRVKGMYTEPVEEVSVVLK